MGTKLQTIKFSKTPINPWKLFSLKRNVYKHNAMVIGDLQYNHWISNDSIHATTVRKCIIRPYLATITVNGRTEYAAIIKDTVSALSRFSFFVWMKILPFRIHYFETYFENDNCSFRIIFNWDMFDDTATLVQVITYRQTSYTPLPRALTIKLRDITYPL